jgi:hypothetical protein
LLLYSERLITKVPREAEWGDHGLSRRWPDTVKKQQLA